MEKIMEYAIGVIIHAAVILFMKAILPAEHFKKAITSTEYWITVIILYSIIILVTVWKKKRRREVDEIVQSIEQKGE